MSLNKNTRKKRKFRANKEEIQKRIKEERKNKKRKRRKKSSVSNLWKLSPTGKTIAVEELKQTKENPHPPFLLDVKLKSEKRGRLINLWDGSALVELYQREKYMKEKDGEQKEYTKNKIERYSISRKSPVRRLK